MMDEVMGMELAERLDAVVVALEAATELLAEKHATLAAAAQQIAGAEQTVTRIVATSVSPREEELEAQLAEAGVQLAAAEDQLAELRASAAHAGHGRKTVVAMQAKHGEGFEVSIVRRRARQPEHRAAHCSEGTDAARGLAAIAKRNCKHRVVRGNGVGTE